MRWLLLILCSVRPLAWTIQGKILYSYTTGYNKISLTPVDVPFDGILGPGLTAQFFSYNDNGTHFKIFDRNAKIVHDIVPNVPLYNYFAVTLAAEKTGLRVFINGDEHSFINHDIYQIATIQVGPQGLSQAIIAKEFPLWALYEQSKHTRLLTSYGTHGDPVPQMYNLAGLQPFVKPEDYVVIIGQMDNRTSTIELKIDSKDGSNITPLYIKINLDEEDQDNPFLIVSSYENKKLYSRDTSSGRFPLTREGRRFIIALVCEHTGWRIYINGQEFHFFYHRFGLHRVHDLYLLKSEEDPEPWRVIRFIYKYK